MFSGNGDFIHKCVEEAEKNFELTFVSNGIVEDLAAFVQTSSCIVLQGVLQSSAAVLSLTLYSMF